jgi:hypothetical protein
MPDARFEGGCHVIPLNTSLKTFNLRDDVGRRKRDLPSGGLNTMNCIAAGCRDHSKTIHTWSETSSALLAARFLGGFFIWTIGTA